MFKVKFQRLLEPGQIGEVKTKNRLYKTAAGTCLSDGSGMVTQRHEAFYGALARGGVGLIVVEHAAFERSPATDISAGAGTFLRLDDDRFIPGLQQLVNLIHRYNCPSFLQLMHAGPTNAIDPVASSFLSPEEIRERQPYHKTYLLERPKAPRELTTDEIEELVYDFGLAAERARKAGFDGVELNASNGHLLNTFLSRVWNRRGDKYGAQSVETRAQFITEIIQEIKKRLGSDFTVTLVFNAVEYGLEGGTTLRDGVAFAQLFEKAGADGIVVRAYGYKHIGMDILWPERIFYPEPPKPLPQELDWSHNGSGAHLPVAAAVKEGVSVPVLATGRITLELGEGALRQGKVDFIGLTRALVADPELPNKVASGRIKEIAPCTACSHCLEANTLRAPLTCRINGFVGGEEEYILRPTERKKRIVVVGGGAAGMEAARVAANRGHEVVLYEKGRRLGGLLPAAELIKGTEIENLRDIVRYYQHELRRVGVKLKLGKEFKLSDTKEIQADALIIATGGVQTSPEIPGDGKIISSGELRRHAAFLLQCLGVRPVEWLTQLWLPIGKRVVVIGATIHGCQLAEFLVKRGRKVTIVDIGEEVGKGLPLRNKLKLVKWLGEKGVNMFTGVRYEKVAPKGLALRTREGDQRFIQADTIVSALPLRSNDELAKGLKDKVPEAYLVGDCREPGLIIDAIRRAHQIARAL